MYSVYMDGVELELVCPCGHENFERIVVQRKPHRPIVTDFVALCWLQDDVLGSATSTATRTTNVGQPDARDRRA
jgi:hypothetical protein